MRVGLAGGGVCGDPRTFSDPVQDTEESRESARGRYRTSPAAARPAAPGGARGGGHSRSRLSCRLCRVGGRPAEGEAGDGPEPERGGGARRAEPGGVQKTRGIPIRKLFLCVHQHATACKPPRMRR